eukprot:CAMPEP_0203968130 /NCGR_PEP_ID=MMETSP0359-20131031/96795_1 /ASSEMBLY_ACC=CAM_ASM_000338 /TAXON_ID=268821 /ORGANISM="Scrippsiella Hangoei, Strain SHTV-5" /LENGTH=205 /DNA_ID=CAMNT_0050906053 /DNA_START=43 /DNA_END=661 /DNA_ORIENTATION=+
MVGRHLEVVLAVLLFASGSANSPSQQLRGSTREPVALALGETNSTTLAAVLATAASMEAPSAPDVPAWCQYMPQDAAATAAPQVAAPAVGTVAEMCRRSLGSRTLSAADVARRTLRQLLRPRLQLARCHEGCRLQCRLGVSTCVMRLQRSAGEHLALEPSVLRMRTTEFRDDGQPPSSTDVMLDFPFALLRTSYVQRNWCPMDGI